MIAATSPSILDGAGTEGHRVAGVWWLMFTLAAIVYVVVAGFVIVAFIRGRRRSATTESTGGEETSALDRWFIWVGGVGAPVVILAVLGVVTVTTTRDLRNPTPGEMRVDVRGERWWWDIDYPDAGVRTANELHIPVGQPVDITLTSDNVAHSFWVPQLAGKVDLIPGQTNHLHLEPTQVGTFRGECAEFCGVQHAHMDFIVVVQSQEDFGRWLARRTSGAGTSAETEETAAGEQAFQTAACAGCHTVKGTPATGTLGPDLSDFGARSTIGAATLPNTPDNLAAWIRDSQHDKPGNLMPPISLTPEQDAEIVAYLESLK